MLVEIDAFFFAASGYAFLAANGVRDRDALPMFQPMLLTAAATLV
jgi:hypothetical protein